MKKRFYLYGFLIIVAALSSGCSKKSKTQTPGPSEEVLLPLPDHVIFVWFENKSVDSVIHNSNAPFINSLIAKGTLFTNMHAITHPSYPNYMDFFAGQSNDVTDDACILTPFMTDNLYTILKKAGKSFAWYSEDLPFTGSDTCFSGGYVAKHNPTSVFTNVPSSQNKTFSSFPSDYTQLENVVCISPNLENDMHDGKVSTGDKWLQTNLSSLTEWCLTHNSIFLVYFDEDDGSQLNLIPAIAIGEHVKAGYSSSQSYNHYSWTKTVCEIFHADSTWTTNLAAATAVKNCWK